MESNRLLNRLAWDIGNDTIEGLFLYDDPTESFENAHNYLSQLMPWDHGDIIIFIYNLSPEDPIEVTYRADQLQTGYDVIGAINTFYSRSVTREQLEQLLPDPENDMAQINIIRNRRGILGGYTLADTLIGHREFMGLIPVEGRYGVYTVGTAYDEM